MSIHKKSPKFGAEVFDYPAHFVRLGKALVNSGQGKTAVALVKKTLAARPGNRLLELLSRDILSYNIPDFHADMLRDARRNLAYRRAIESTVAGKRVLDIGTGSGLLAMMAAKAGASQVFACEANPMVAATALEIIAANGLSEKIIVYDKHSHQLDRDIDLDGGVDVIVSEIISNNLLGEGILPALSHARQYLAADGAVFLPRRASIRVALADLPPSAKSFNNAADFDLSLFDRHLSSQRMVWQGTKDIILRSAATDLFSFEFAATLTMHGQAEMPLISTGGRVSGILQWLWIELASGTTYENALSPDQQSHWALIFTPLHIPRETIADEPINVHGWHDATTVLAWI